VDNAVSNEVRRLIAAGITSIDHVDVLFHLRRGACTVPALAAASRFAPATVNTLLTDLERTGLVSRDGDRFAVTAVRVDCAAIDDLLTVYNARPVTLIRVIYGASV
jgi:DNA-binding IclR family transcriptional regulator